MGDLQEIDAALEETLSSKFGIDPTEYDETTPLGAEGLDLDSLALLELAELLEMKLDVSISDEELEGIDTVGELNDALRA